MATIGVACVLIVSASGCGSGGGATTSSGGGATTTRSATPLGQLRSCLRRDGYAVTAESAHDVGTAPRRFEFIAVWNVLNPSRVALALTFSRNTAGAKQALTWTRSENAKIGRGKVSAPVVRIDRVDVLWTAKPGVHDVHDVYGCIRQEA